MWKLLLCIICGSLFAESSPKKLRLFNLDLHISVIADVGYIFEALGHEVVTWSLSSHSWVFGKDKDFVEIVNEKTWLYLNRDMCDQFYERYKDYLSQFDGFVVTHTPCFALLYEKFNKPIIIVNSTRYENPFTLQPQKWQWLNDYLKNGVEKGQIIIVSNNKADQHYLKYYTGIESEHIPSLCLYTNARYTGKNRGFYFKGDFPGLSLKNKSLEQNGKLQQRYPWQELYDFQGIVHMPYQMSTMSLFEEYSAAVPLFFPSPSFLIYLQCQYQILHQLTLYQFWHAEPPDTSGDLNNLYNPEILSQWVERADYYDEENMPYIQYYDSYEHLEFLLETADLGRISRQMHAHQLQREQIVLEKWQTILDACFSNPQKATQKNFFPQKYR